MKPTRNGDKAQGRKTMEKEWFIRWNNGNEFGDDGSFGGTIKIQIYTLDRFSIRKVSGSTIPTVELIRLLWSNPIFDDLRKYVSTLTRKNTWGVGMRTGMSGCSDYWVEFLAPSNSVNRSRRIFHDSMMGSFNEDFHDIWSKDFFDLLWWFKEKGFYKESFEENSSFKFVDVTDEVISRRDAFFKDSFEPECGFGHEAALIDEDLLYKDPQSTIDYSNYTPTDTEEKEEEDEDEFV